MKENEGKCIAIRKGKVIFSDANPDKVMDQIMKTKNPQEYYFASIKRY